MFLEKLQSVLKEEILFNYSLKKLTSFKVGGNCKALIRVRNSEELANVISLLNYNEKIYYILGGGTNLVFNELGYFGFIIKLICDKYEKLVINQGLIKVWAGVKSANVLKLALNETLFGFDCLTGIPGSVGGAVKMNAGVSGKEISSIIEAIEFIDKKANSFIVKKKKLCFEYRALTSYNDCVISHTYFKANEKDFNLEAKVKQLLEKRKKTQPQGLANAGSIFKNPLNDYAGRLIEAVGLKGYKIGGAQISTVHANFIVNTGLASSQDIYYLMKLTFERVHEKFGIKLKPELKILNEYAKELCLC